MRVIHSKTRRNLVVAGLATLTAPKALQTVVSAAEARQRRVVVLPDGRRVIQYGPPPTTPAPVSSPEPEPKTLEYVPPPAPVRAPEPERPPRTGEVKVQFAHRTGRWGIPAGGWNIIPIPIRNQFAQGTEPVVTEVQIHFRLDFPILSAMSVFLRSPDGFQTTLMSRPAYGIIPCTAKGVDIVIVDTDVENCCAGLINQEEIADYCPERALNDARAFFGRVERYFGYTKVIFQQERMSGLFHTHKQKEYRHLPRFNGRPAVGDWQFGVSNHLNYDVNEVIRQVDLTVYSKW